MLLGIDHVVIAVEDPDHAAAELETAVGLRSSDGGRHASLGTFNRLVWLGDAYLELIGVSDQALARRSWIGRPTVAALATGGGLVTWAIATNSIDADSAALRAAGSDLSAPQPGERRRPDGAMVRWRLAAPPSLGPLEPPFLIEHDTGSAEWSDADRTERACATHPAGGRVRLEALELAVPLADLRDRLQAYARAVGLRFRPSLVGGGSRDASVGSHRLRLVPSRDRFPRPPTIRLVGSGNESRLVELFGVRIDVRSIAGSHPPRS